MKVKLAFMDQVQDEDREIELIELPRKDDFIILRSGWWSIRRIEHDLTTGKQIVSMVLKR